MPHLAFFVSSHGFGHMARASAVIEALAERQPELSVDVFGTGPSWFWDESTRARVHLRSLEHDPGLAQSDALDIDHDATVARLVGLMPPAAAVLESVAGLLGAGEFDAVVSDISPLGLAAGRRAGLPTVLVENFTWDWIYRPYAGLHPVYTAAIAWVSKQVATVHLHLQCDPVCRPSAQAIRVPPIARAIRDRSAPRAALGIGPGERLVLLSMGGIPHRFGNLSAAASIDARFVILGELAAEDRLPDNCTLLPHHSGLYHPDLMAAADVVVGKLGYSTLAEALAGGTAYGYVLREDFAESRVLAAYADRHLPTRAFSEDAFADGSWLGGLESLIEKPPSKPRTVGGANAVADAISARLGWERGTL